MNRKIFLERAGNICESVIDGECNATYNLFLKEANEIAWDINGNIAGFLKEYGGIHLKMKGSIENDIKRVTINYGRETMRHNRIWLWDDLNIWVAEIAYMYNTSYKKISFFMSENCLFFNEKHEKIADNIEDFLEYLLAVKCEYHEPVSNETLKKLKDAGWYPERNIDISELVSQCENDGVFLSDAQKRVISEFGNITLSYADGSLLYISNKRKPNCSYFRKMVSEKNDPRFHPLTNSFGTDIVQIGDNDNAMGYLYLTVDGMLIDDHGFQYGLNVLEGLHVLLNE